MTEPMVFATATAVFLLLAWLLARSAHTKPSTWAVLVVAYGVVLVGVPGWALAVLLLVVVWIVVRGKARSGGSSERVMLSRVHAQDRRARAQIRAETRRANATTRWSHLSTVLRRRSP